MERLKSTLGTLAGALLLSATVHAQTTTWDLDRSHSSIGFSVDHLVISETVGEFNDYTMTVRSDKDDFTDAEFEVIIEAKSIDTKDEKRDEHLKSADFFDVEKHPAIVFKGKKFSKISAHEYKVIGTLTLHGVTREVSLDAEFGGIVKDPWGGTRAGLKVWGAIDRYDYNLEYNSVLEAGGLAIGREVRIECRVELIKG